MPECKICAKERPFRILAFDGGGILSLIGLYLLKYIEREAPGFLGGVDMFAGTSSGGINALLLAATPRDDDQTPNNTDKWIDALDSCIAFWQPQPLETSLGRLLRAMGGGRPVFSGKGLADKLHKRFDDRTLKDLPNHVVIPSFKLSGMRFGQKSWMPKIFHYCPELAPDDGAKSIVDVALATSASPTFMPIHFLPPGKHRPDQDAKIGHVDGGLFANNPSMCAVVQALPNLQQLRKVDQDHEGSRELDVERLKLSRDVKDIHLFSLGLCQSNVSIDTQDPEWGWQQWMLGRRHPLALVEATFQSDSMAVDHQCLQLLGTRQYFRLEPLLKVPTSRNVVARSQLPSLEGYAEQTWKKRRQYVLNFLKASPSWGKPTSS